MFWRLELSYSHSSVTFVIARSIAMETATHTLDKVGKYAEDAVVSTALPQDMKSPATTTKIIKTACYWNVTERF